MLERQRIRKATVAALRTAATAAGDRVYPTAILPWRRELPLPALGVYTLEEPGEALDGGDSGPLGIRYALQLRIDVVTETPTLTTLTPADRLEVDTADVLDALCEEVTEALLASPDWRRATGIEAVLSWSTGAVTGATEETDRRTMAASITAQLRYTCFYEPAIADEFAVLDLSVDVIDPAADPNTTGHPTDPPAGYPGGYPGPDGRIEIHARFPLPARVNGTTTSPEKET